MFSNIILLTILVTYKRNITRQKIMILAKKQSAIALGYFLLITILGILLRSFSVIVIDFNYRHIVHAHSHVAILG